MNIQCDIFETARGHKPGKRPGKNSYNQKVLDILEDRRPHSVIEIMEILFPSGKCGLFRLSARVWDLNNLYHYPWEIVGCHRTGRYWYEIVDK